MTLHEAITLIQNPNIISDTKSIWADLGCGSGLFTHALASLLNEESIVYAIDKDVSTFRKVFPFKSAAIKTIELNFENAALPFDNLDGIMMANSLHFVKDKKNFLRNMKSNLNKNGSFIIVEYDTKVANQWVPYPVSFLRLKELFHSEGYKMVIKINERPSLFNRGNLYSAMIKS